jgi:cytoplasmic axial filament protein
MKWEMTFLNKFIITRQHYVGDSYFTALLDEKDKFREIAFHPLSEENQVVPGIICIARVKKIAANLDAAFVDIAKGVTCYLETAHIKDAWFSKQCRSGKLTEGDELVVQITKEAIKTKYPIADTKLSLTGKYFVLTNEKRPLAISSKLSADEKERLSSQVQLFEQMPLSREETAADTTQNAGQKEKRKPHSLIVRTNAAGASQEELEAEYKQLLSDYQKLAATFLFRTCYTILLPPKKFYENAINHLYQEELGEIITDDKNIYEELQQLYAGNPDILSKIRFYENDAISLGTLYSFETQIQRAISERVWMKSGAYLIIQPTEALTVIDVNSGKNTSGKNAEEYYYKINLEAAAEISRQLRLRNISGIVIVDFINMAKEEQRKELMHQFRLSLKEDPVPVRLVDITKLGLVELTRKKERKTLLEQVAQLR